MIVTSFKVLFRLTPDPDLKVKVTDLHVKVFKSSYFPNHTMDLLHIFFLMIDTGQRFYSAVPASMPMTSRSRS